MRIPHQMPYMTPEEYLAFEERAKLRHEYIDGYVYAMTGATRTHNVIGINIVSLIRPHLRGGPCRVFMETVKVRVEATNSFYYPDVMVACDKYDHKSVYTNQPVLVIEVLSPSTAATDRREKLYAYRQLPSLKEYLIVHQKRIRVEMHRQNAAGGFDVLEFGPGSEIELQSIPAGPLRFPIEAIYEDVDFPEGKGFAVSEGDTHEYNPGGPEEYDYALDW